MARGHYAADRPELVRTVELDGLVALFHLPSNMTHILAPPAPQILSALAEGPATPAEILARIEESFAVEGGDELVGLMQARLDELEAAGLVWRT